MLMLQFAGVPSEPNNLSVVSKGCSSIEVQWSAPNSDGGDPVTQYHLLIKKEGEGNFNQFYSGAEMHYKATGLSLGTNYEMKVTAVNSIGEGAASNVLLSQTDKLPRKYSLIPQLINLIWLCCCTHLNLFA